MPPRQEPDRLPPPLGEPADAAPEKEGLARRLDKPMGALGLVFVLVVLGQSLAREAWLVTTLGVAGWALWAVFVLEFGYRAVRATDRRRFWARNWWQLLFLALPFLRFARALTLLRAARVGGVVSAAVRGSRSARRLLSGRIGWLSAVTVVVVLAVSQLLYVLGAYASYATALYDAALATVSGQPLSADTGLARVLDVALAVYSVAVFATLAGALGAYYLERRGAPGRRRPDGLRAVDRAVPSSSGPVHDAWIAIAKARQTRSPVMTSASSSSRAPRPTSRTSASSDSPSTPSNSALGGFATQSPASGSPPGRPNADDGAQVATGRRPAPAAAPVPAAPGGVVARDPG